MLCVFALFAASLRADMIAIQNVSIINPDSGSVAPQSTVLIVGDRIAEVGPNGTVTLPKGTRLVEGKGKFLIPGLWDMHVHLMDSKTLPLFTANGVTGIRTMWGAAHQLGWRKQVMEGKIIGPRMVIASPIIDGPVPVWPGSVGVANAAQAKEAVRKAKADGYDFIKVYSLLSRESYLAIAEESKRLKMPYAGHVPYSIGILEAGAAGQLTMEHVGGITIECAKDPQYVRSVYEEAAQKGFSELGSVAQKLAGDPRIAFSESAYAELPAKLAKTGMWHCPTLVVLYETAHMDDAAKFNDPRMKYVSPFASARWNPQNDFRFKSRTAADWERAKASFKQQVEHTRAFHKAGVQMLTGSDCLNPFVFPGFSVHEELALLLQAGLSPAQALASATLNPAKMLGQSENMGTVAKGKYADLVLLSENPLADIRNTRKIEGVVQRGKWLDRSALDTALKTCEYPRAQ